MQSANVVLDKQSVSVQELEAAQMLLRLTEERVNETKDAVAETRVEAAQLLADKRTLEQEAEVAARQVADRVKDHRRSKQLIQAAKQRERDRLATLKKERERVETRLRKIAERRARQAQRALLAQQRQASRLASTQGSGFLSFPVDNASITSSYGMRVHPILKVYKLHDGTDFSAACGSPVYAAAPGRILARYFNAGYGNHIIMDHGVVRGVSLSTSYSHLTSFVARPGQDVKRGQLIGYAGTTGYSTGCHLHFMVYRNGFTTNPVGWL
jgi:murein DD-endopeptidase MepM/ murein hydrolase activator NlpD